MSTRAMITDGKTARYVHSDGYPENMLPALKSQIKKLGVEALVANNWSAILPTRVIASESNFDTYSPADFENCDAEYVYEISATEIKGFIPRGKFLGLFETVTL